MRERLALLGSLLLPLSASVIWGVKQRGYPIADPGEYLATAQKIYFTFHSGTLLNWLHSLYMIRNYKPILHPAFGSLFLILTQGRVEPAIYLFGAVCLTIFLIFCFRSFRLKLPIFESSLATTLMGLLPWCLHGSRFFSSEIPELAVAAGVFYFFCRCWQDESVRSACWFGISLGIGLCVRLDEVGLFFSVPLLVWVVKNVRARTFKLRDLFACFLCSFPFVYLLFKSTNTTTPHLEGRELVEHILILCSPVILVFFLAKRLRLNPVLNSAFTFAYLTMALWYAPFFRILSDWVSQSSYAPALIAEQAAYHTTRLGFFWTIERELGGIPLALIALAALPVAFGIRNEKRKMALLALAALAVLVPEVIGSTSNNCSDRYYYSSQALLHAVLLVLALSPGVWKRVRVALVGAALIPSLNWDVQSIWFPKLAQRLSDNYNNDYRYYAVSPADHDPATGFLDALAHQIDGKHSFGLIPRSFPGQPWRFGYDPSELSIIARERGLDWDFVRALPPYTDDGVDLYLLGPLEGPDPDSADKEGFSQRCVDTNPADWSKFDRKLVSSFSYGDGESVGHFYVLSPVLRGVH